METLDNFRNHLRNSDNLKNTVAGAGAGCVTSILTCPLDVVKTRLQNQGHLINEAAPGHKNYKGTAGTLTRIWAEEGIRGLYRGLGPTIYGYLPTWAIYFSVYDYLKLAVADKSKRSHDDVVVHIFSAMGAGAASSIMTNPLWVIKTRFMTQSERTTYHYRNTLDAFVTIWRQEGFRGFYKGLTPSLLGIVHVAVQFPLYEKLKIMLRPESGESLGTVSILVASSLSKMAASVVTYPHEVIRTRLQNQCVPPFKYYGVMHTVSTINREEGWTAFYKGMPTNLFRTVPASALTILTYELIVKKLNQL
ncbi:mitochondrial carrier [Basidiobolus meristosporus CBS 931.73]|uniref:Mitochondrial carrier n=1 Tax=Basidiobolus meristosporus CBS 931.73 TaxID=1314790 RepID=A0A1Y1XS33_9FUNG|nr:mitochondrial carrier [Basidiobolus meristosporus CBS 931.73]|eukprot:ORX88572.1 mitochondrial carrier [Basidiobolus meristosporus CBS 931.73]